MWQQLLSDGIRDTVNNFKEAYWDKEHNRRAKRRIRYTVADARAAGIHPLAALGQGYSSPPAFSHIEAMGQDTSRALAATMSPAERNLENRMRVAQVESAEADAMFNKARAKDYQDNISKPVPTTVSKPAEVIKSYDTQNKHIEAGQPSEIKFHHTATGGFGTTVSADLKELVEDSPDETIAATKRWIYNVFGSEAYAPPMELVRKKYPKATGVRFSIWTMDWQPVYHGKDPKNWKERYQKTFDPYGDPK